MKRVNIPLKTSTSQIPLKAFRTNASYIHLEAGTGFGKTTMLMKRSETERTVFAVPLISQVRQMQTIFSKRSDIVYIFGGEKSGLTDPNLSECCVVCTYDQLEKVIAVLGPAEIAERTLVIDEAHKLYQAGSYRASAINHLIKVIKDHVSPTQATKWKHLITTSATYSEHLVELLGILPQKWTRVSRPIDEKMARTIEYRYYDESTPQSFISHLVQRLNKKSDGSCVIARINDKGIIGMLQKYLSQKGYKVQTVHSDKQDEDEVKEILANQEIPEGTDILLTTSLLDEAINFNNYEGSIDSMHIYDQRIHPEQIVQFIGRIRKANPPVFIHMSSDIVSDIGAVTEGEVGKEFHAIVKQEAKGDFGAFEGISNGIIRAFQKQGASNRKRGSAWIKQSNSTQRSILDFLPIDPLTIGNEKELLPNYAGIMGAVYSNESKLIATQFHYSKSCIERLLPGCNVSFKKPPGHTSKKLKIELDEASRKSNDDYKHAVHITKNKLMSLQHGCADFKFEEICLMVIIGSGPNSEIGSIAQDYQELSGVLAEFDDITDAILNENISGVFQAHQGFSSLFVKNMHAYAEQTFGYGAEITGERCQEIVLESLKKTSNDDETFKETLKTTKGKMKGIYTLNDSSFVDAYYGKHAIWGQNLDVLAEKMAEILNNAEALDEYRRQRREGRGQFIGGGFGLSGAAKGMMQAGALNAVTGLAHGVFNLAAKGVSIVADEAKKQSLFADAETKEGLCFDLEVSIAQMHRAVIEAANALANADIEPGIGVAEGQQAVAIYDNVNKGRLPKEKVIEALSRCLSLSPYEKFVYDYILREYGDPTGSLEQAALYFGVDISADKGRALHALTDGLYANNRLLPEQKTERLGEVIQGFAKLGYSAEHATTRKAIRELKERLWQDKLRTLDCSTASLYSQNLPELERFAQAIDYPKGLEIAKENIEFALGQKAEALKDADKLGRTIIALGRLGFGLIFLLLGLGGIAMAVTKPDSLVIALILGGLGYYTLTTVKGTVATKALKGIAHLVIAIAAITAASATGLMPDSASTWLALIPAGGIGWLGWHIHQIASNRLKAQGLTPAKPNFLPAAGIGVAIYAALVLFVMYEDHKESAASTAIPSQSQRRLPATTKGPTPSNPATPSVSAIDGSQVSTSAGTLSVADSHSLSLNSTQLIPEGADFINLKQIAHLSDRDIVLITTNPGGSGTDDSYRLLTLQANANPILSEEIPGNGSDVPLAKPGTTDLRFNLGFKDGLRQWLVYKDGSTTIQAEKPAAGEPADENDCQALYTLYTTYVKGDQYQPRCSSDGIDNAGGMGTTRAWNHYSNDPRLHLDQVKSMAEKACHGADTNSYGAFGQRACGK